MKTNVAETSIAAYHARDPQHSGRMMRRLYDRIADAGPKGALVAVVALEFGVPHSSLCQFAQDLERIGLVYRSGEKRKTPHGRAAFVYRATELRWDVAMSRRIRPADAQGETGPQLVLMGGGR